MMCVALAVSVKMAASPVLPGGRLLANAASSSRTPNHKRRRLKVSRGHRGAGGLQLAAGDNLQNNLDLAG